MWRECYEPLDLWGSVFGTEHGSPVCVRVCMCVWKKGGSSSIYWHSSSPLSGCILFPPFAVGREWRVSPVGGRGLHSLTSSSTGRGVSVSVCRQSVNIILFASSTVGELGECAVLIYFHHLLIFCDSWFFLSCGASERSLWDGITGFLRAFALLYGNFTFFQNLLLDVVDHSGLKSRFGKKIRHSLNHELKSFRYNLETRERTLYVHLYVPAIKLGLCFLFFFVSFCVLWHIRRRHSERCGYVQPRLFAHSWSSCCSWKSSHISLHSVVMSTKDLMESVNAFHYKLQSASLRREKQTVKSDKRLIFFNEKIHICINICMSW